MPNKHKHRCRYVTGKNISKDEEPIQNDFVIVQSKDTDDMPKEVASIQTTTNVKSQPECTTK